jgi:hypothetical protein
MTTPLEIAREARDAAGLADHRAYIARLDAHTAYKAAVEAEEDIDEAHAAYKAAVEADHAAEAVFRKAQAAFLAAGGEGF